ncbi:MAG: cell division protein FtsZ [Bacteroidaceae bacterium]|nr:cell division protein FtsZ [Bacteroidaceae bacterium]
MPENVLNFAMPKQKPCIIKVIGVGGGGGNAVKHMYNEGIHDVSFVVCNTDSQALSDNPVPNRLQLGAEGLGAGNRPERARKAAEESIEDIRRMLDDGTKMAFITAGMGGGTGTGAAPIIAREARQMGILTVGIVTIPFKFEGIKKIDKALDGVDEMQKYVDALLVVNNEKLREIYPSLPVFDAFGKADDTLSVAARSIAEIITVHGIVNLDFRDVCTVMKDGGVAIMSTGYGDGDNRVSQAIQNALHSPLLNNSDIYRSKRVLLNITFCKSGEGESLMMDEMNEIHEFMSRFDSDVETKFGIANDETLGKQVKVTILATGFMLNDVLSDVEGSRKELPSEEDELQRQEREERRGKYYGDSDSNRARHSYRIYKFVPESLDNDEIISMVETTPTYKRTNETLRNINALTQDQRPYVAPEKEPTVDGNVIVFD